MPHYRSSTNTSHTNAVWCQIGYSSRQPYVGGGNEKPSRAHMPRTASPQDAAPDLARPDHFVSSEIDWRAFLQFLKFLPKHDCT